MSVKTLLNDEFESQIKELHKLNVGGEEYKVGVDGVTKIADRLIEIEKLNVESQNADRSQEIEADLKARQLEVEHKDRLIGHGIAIGSTLLSLGLVVWGTKGSWEFEKTGTVANGPGREFLRKIYGLVRFK